MKCWSKATNEQLNYKIIEESHPHIYKLLYILGVVCSLARKKILTKSLSVVEEKNVQYLIYIIMKMLMKRLEFKPSSSEAWPGFTKKKWYTMAKTQTTNNKQPTPATTTKKKKTGTCPYPEKCNLGKSCGCVFFWKGEGYMDWTYWIWDTQQKLGCCFIDPYPRLPNTLWGSIWTPKKYLKHLLRRYLED